MPNRARVGFIITTFNNKGIIGDCIASIMGQSYRDFVITVVDDHSSDGTPEYVRKKFPKVKVIVKDRQTGPSISRNKGIKAIKSEYLAFMDSDVTLDRNWLKRLLDFLEKNPYSAIAGGKLLYTGNRKIINSAGGGLYRIGIGFDRGSGAPASQYNKQEDVLYVCSAAMLVRKQLFDRIGGFDETYFYGHEDTDLGWRANLSGARVVYIPDAIAYHRVNQTVKDMGDNVYFHSVKNRIRSLLKNYSCANLMLYLPMNLIITKLNIIFTKGHRQAKLRGIAWNLANLNDTLRSRKQVQKLRIKSDSQLSKLFSPLGLALILGRRSM